MKWVIAALLIWAAWHYLRPKPKPKTGPGLSADQMDARAVLGVSARADADTIRAAHRRLLAEEHPDRGGSGDRARRINAARDLLLGRPLP